jgi:cysteine desulfurase
MIYLDHNATSPMLPDVQAAMAPWFGVPANPASVHQLGQRASNAVERAREQVAALVGGVPAGVIFTSGATEANHMFLRGIGARRLALAKIEHPSVRAAALTRQGEGVHWLPTNAEGTVALDALPDDVDAISMMAANHETGVLQPVEALLAHGGRCVLHVDATQAAGRVPLDLGAVDGVVLSAHKLGGPGGVGALVLRHGDPFPALLSGGAQERGRRAGSVNTAGVVGFGAACELALAECTARQGRWRPLQLRIESEILDLGGRVVAAQSQRVSNTVAFALPGWDGELMVQALDLRGVAVSHGAACASGSLEPSSVLVAMGDPDPRSVVRISLGPRTDKGEVERALTVLRDLAAP